MYAASLQLSQRASSSAALRPSQNTASSLTVAPGAPQSEQRRSGIALLLDADDPFALHERSIDRDVLHIRQRRKNPERVGSVGRRIEAQPLHLYLREGAGLFAVA